MEGILYYQRRRHNKSLNPPACELAQGIELLRLSQLPLHLFHILLSFAAFGNIPRDLGKAEKFIVIVANGVDDNARPKERAIFADAPTLFFVATILQCESQGPRRSACRLICLGIE